MERVRLSPTTPHPPNPSATYSLGDVPLWSREEENKIVSDKYKNNLKAFIRLDAFEWRLSFRDDSHVCNPRNRPPEIILINSSTLSLGLTWQRFHSKILRATRLCSPPLRQIRGKEEEGGRIKGEGRGVCSCSRSVVSWPFETPSGAAGSYWGQSGRPRDVVLYPTPNHSCSNIRVHENYTNINYTRLLKGLTETPTSFTNILPTWHCTLLDKHNKA